MLFEERNIHGLRRFQEIRLPCLNSTEDYLMVLANRFS